MKTKAVLIAAEVNSFDRAETVLEKIGEIKISGRHIGRMTHETGGRLLKQQRERSEMFQRKKLPVEVENIHRNRSLGKPLTRAILDGAQQIAVPAIVATLSICIVFFPVVLLVGPARFLFTSLALSVVLSMMASYLLSRTLVPSLARLLMAKAHGGTLIVAAPAKDVLLYSGDDKPEALDALRTLSADVMRRAPGALSSALLRWTPSGWQIVP